jgi:hypothetical protein
MRITLNKAEHALLREYGTKFREKTGKTYSTYYIMMLLSQLYADRLDDDLSAVLDEKLREEKETQAEELGTNK